MVGSGGSEVLLRASRELQNGQQVADHFVVAFLAPVARASGELLGLDQCFRKVAFTGQDADEFNGLRR
jgi:hypothetical protein